MKIYKIIFILISASSNLHANENVNLVNIVTTVNKASTVNKTDTYIDLTSPADINRIIAPNSAVGVIPFNKQVGVFSISVLSPKKSKIYLRWDNTEFLYSRIGKEVKFRRAGDYKTISFNATKPVKGNIYLMNSKNQILRTIPYTVKKQGQYSQSVRTYLRNSDSGDNTDQDITISYNLSKRSSYGAPRWNMGVSTSTDLDDNDSKSLGVSFGYSW